MDHATCEDQKRFQGKDISVRELTELVSGACQHETNENANQLLHKGFERVARGYDDASIALKFFAQYEKEEAFIFPQPECKNEDIRSLLDCIWRMINCDIVRRTCDRCKADLMESQRELAIACMELSSTLYQTFSDEQFLRKFTPRVFEIANAGKTFVSDGQLAHAVVALYATSKLLKLKSIGDESVHGILSCAWQMTFAAAGLAERDGFGPVIVYCVIPLMQEMQKFVRSIRSSSHKLRAEGEAWCLMRIGLCFHYAGEHAQYAKMCDSAIDLIRRKFKKEAKNQQVYGACLNNAGSAHERLGDAERANGFFEMSLDAYMHAKDWPNEQRKQATLDTVKHNLTLYERERADEKHKKKIFKSTDLSRTEDSDATGDS